MKIYVVVHFVQDSHYHMLGAYSSRGLAENDWGGLIEKLKDRQWESCDIMEAELDVKTRTHLDEFGDLQVGERT